MMKSIIAAPTAAAAAIAAAAAARVCFYEAQNRTLISDKNLSRPTAWTLRTH